MTDRDRRNVRLLQAAHRLSAKGYGSAQRTTDALERIKAELDELDGYSSGGDGDARGASEHTQPEAFMLRRWHWTNSKEDLRDAIANIEDAVAHHSHICARILGLDREEVRLCDGRSYEGAEVAWTPYSRDQANGWHDPLCQDAADASGLCAACRIRERRWRLANGLQPRKHTIAEEDVA